VYTGSSKAITCSSPLRMSRTRICRSALLRSYSTRWSRNTSKPSTSTVSRCGTRSRQAARDGSLSGAVTSLKLLAPSALVRMTKRPSWWFTEYSRSFCRGDTTRNGSLGRFAGATHASEVV
jgi:hypothetical protein